MKLRSCFFLGMAAFCCAGCVSVASAQNSTLLFSPLNVRVSQTGAGYGASEDIFNTNTLNLTCPASPSAVLSSAASTVPSSSTANLLVDNNIDVTNLTTANGPTNICTGGVNGGQNGASFQNCFTSSYQTNAGNLVGVDPDTIVSTGGVHPIDISSQLVPGAQQLKIDLVDEGGYVASSTLYLNTNCTPGGVVGPAQVSGNPIPPNNPTPTQLNQSFNFNNTGDQLVGFQYDLTGAYNAPNGSLSINQNGVNPQVGDSGLEPLVAYPLQVTGTSFATSMCLVHTGELVNGNPACKLFTLECTVGTGNDASGAQCPVSSLPNEVLQDVFDGPAFTLPDISTPSGTTFHEGMGFLMASEGWNGGPCTFDPASGLQALLCPLNLLTSFSGPGTFTGSGQTTHPNSTFISIAQVPEDLTTVTITNSEGSPVGLGPGNWTNNPNPYFQLSSQPPNLAGTTVPHAASFIPAPIQTITYGLSSGLTAPAPGTTSASDTVLTNGVSCPSPESPGTPAAAVFTPPIQSLSGLADGHYLLHYFAQDCAGTQELKFLQDQSQAWSTNFYTFSINVDTIAPEVASGPTASVPGPYTQGQTVSVSYSCTDDLSGVVQCGSHTFPVGTSSTGMLTDTLPTAATGSQSFTVKVMDAAGNTSTQSLTYQVNPSSDSQVQLTLTPGTVTYPQGTEIEVQIANINGHQPTGQVKIMEGSTVLATLGVNSGLAFDYLSGLSATTHSLYAAYSGDAHNAAGNSAPVSLKVLPVPVTLSLSCWNTPYPYGANFNCGAYASSNAGAPIGNITYTYDNGAAVSLTLAGGSVSFVIPKPPVGNHTLVVTYPAQTNYAASASQTQNFTVSAAPVTVAFTPSSWYVTGGNLTLTAAIQSWSAGAPNATGVVTFTYGNMILGSKAVGATGTAAITIPVSSLPNGNDQLTATYANGTNYASGASTVNVQVAH